MNNAGTRRVTEGVWKGVLLMWRNPAIIEYLQGTETIRGGEFPKRDTECVLRAVDWARAMKDTHGYD